MSTPKFCVSRGTHLFFAWRRGHPAVARSVSEERGGGARAKATQKTAPNSSLVQLCFVAYCPQYAIELVKLTVRLFRLSGQKRKKTLCQGCVSTGGAGLPLTVRGFFVLNSEKWKSHTPARRGEGIFLFFPRLFSDFCRFFPIFADFSRFLPTFSAFFLFFSFLPPFGGSGGSESSICKPFCNLFCIYVSGQNDTSEVSK